MPRVSSAVIVVFAVLACGLAQDCPRNDAEVASTSRLCGKSCITAADCQRNRPCVCDGICGPTCIATSRIHYCDEVPATTGVTLTYVNPDRLFDSVVNAACDAGYIFESGNATRKCKGDANWSGDPYVCALPTCQPPTHVVENAALSRGDVRDSYNVGDWIYYDCDYGYYRDGSNAILCLDSGEWTDPYFICRPKTCPRPNIPNGYVEGTYEFGSSVTAKCYTGYELDGLPYMTCQGDQTWSGYDRTCNKVQCPALNSPANGVTIGNKFEYQNEVRYTCNEGYVVEPAGSEVRRCQAEGAWSGPQEITTCRAINCGELKASYKNFNDTRLIGGSQMGEDYSYGSVVYFRCDSGHTIKGSGSTRCSEEETWTEPVPKCKESTSPVWQQPEALSLQTDPGTCSRKVDFTMPEVTDNSGKVLITSSSHNPGDSFLVGETLVRFTAIDPSDNTATVTMKVTVTDEEAPTFALLQKIELNNTHGECFAIYTPPEVKITDNCAPPPITTSSHNSKQFDVGNTTVKYTATDTQGNSNEAQQMVTVNDIEPPVFKREHIRVLEVETGDSCKPLTDLTLDVTDNCAGELTQTCTSSGSEASTTCNIGNTEVTCTATDAHGNSVTHAYIIKVVGSKVIPHRLTLIKNEGSDVHYTEDLKNRNSVKYIKLVIKIVLLLSTAFNESVSGFIGLEVGSFHPGSIIVEYSVLVDKNSTATNATIDKAVRESLDNNDYLGNSTLKVDRNSIAKEIPTTTAVTTPPTTPATTTTSPMIGVTGDEPCFTFTNEHSKLSNQNVKLPVAIYRTGNVTQQDKVCFGLTARFISSSCSELLLSLPFANWAVKCQFTQCLTFKPQQTRRQSTPIDMKQCVDWVESIKKNTTSEFFDCMEVKLYGSEQSGDGTGCYGDNLKIQYHYNKPPGSHGKKIMIIIVVTLMIVAIAMLVFIFGKIYKKKRAVHNMEKHLNVAIDEKKPLNGEDGSTSEKSSNKSSEVQSPSTTKNGVKKQTKPDVESAV